MGDRTTFVARMKDGSAVCVYGHWAGEGMASSVARGMAHAAQQGRSPDGDTSYCLAAIVRTILNDHHEADACTGVGIYSVAGDDEEVGAWDDNPPVVLMFSESGSTVDGMGWREWCAEHGCPVEKPAAA